MIKNNKVMESRSEKLTDKAVTTSEETAEIVEEVKEIHQEQGDSINVEINPEKPKDERVKINFLEDDIATKILNKKPLESQEEKLSETIGNDAGEARTKIKEEEKKYSEQFTVDDLQEIAEFLITALDAGISTGLRWVAKDTSDAAYEITEKKKRTLVKMFTKIMIKHQIKFSIEFLFMLFLVISYWTPGKKALQRNRKIKQLETNKSQQTEKVVDKEKVDIITKTKLDGKITEFANESNTKKQDITKRKRGQPAK